MATLWCDIIHSRWLRGTALQVGPVRVEVVEPWASKRLMIPAHRSEGVASLSSESLIATFVPNSSDRSLGGMLTFASSEIVPST